MKRKTNQRFLHDANSVIGIKAVKNGAKKTKT